MPAVETQVVLWGDDLELRVLLRGDSNRAWSGEQVPAEVVAGSIDTSLGYASGLAVAVYDLGAGRLTLPNFDQQWSAMTNWSSQRSARRAAAHRSAATPSTCARPAG
jgi:hypothetical protein